MSPAKGRPPSKDPKRNDTRIRLTDSEFAKLEYCSKKTGLTKADVIRRGIDMVYAEVTKK
nr:MAG TPA: NikA, BACTERIAL CONJUGATION, RELAXASE, DNA [Caudoviricetes sp.]